MTKEEAYKIVKKFYQNDNVTENDEFVFVEACNFLIDTENDAGIMLSLGGFYYGKEKYSLAEKYYLMAHKAGDKDAAGGLGFIYYYGRTGERDYKKAFYYFDIARKTGDLEAAMKIADMYHNGYGTEKDDSKYKEILLELHQKLENSDQLFDPVPEINHRLADVYIEEGNPEDAIPLLIKGFSFIRQRIRYNPFWGNYIVCRRTINLIYKICEFDETNMNFYDLFYLMQKPIEVKLIYNGKKYLISSLYDEDKIIVKCGEKYYKSVEDFLIKAMFDNKHTNVIDYEDYYQLEIVHEWEDRNIWIIVDSKI